jgi:hypothetical protein
MSLDYPATGCGGWRPGSIARRFFCLEMSSKGFSLEMFLTLKKEEVVIRIYNDKLLTICFGRELKKNTSIKINVKI